jgi:hypothetical protein
MLSGMFAMLYKQYQALIVFEQKEKLHCAI